MAALNFKITNAGLGLLSQVGAIGPVTLTKVAIGSAGYTPSGTEATLTTQIKQITPEGSSVPTPGIIHITASDSSTDAYAVKEIGLYAGTTLFAIYSQTAAILTKSSGNVALFSIDLALTNIPAGSVTIGSASFQYPPATESVKGVAEIATTAEVAAGTNDSHIVTPLKLAGSPTFVKKSGDTMTGFLTLNADPSSSLHAATKQYVDNLFVGAVVAFPRTTAPAGWLKANGAAVSRAAYAALFAAIGTTHGAGDGSTTFNLPDARGEFIRGLDDGRGVDSGRTLGSLQSDAFASHTHNLSRIASIPVNNTTVSQEPLLTENTSISVASNVSGYVLATGGTETRPRNIVGLYCIKF
ncbi:MAG: tail fiber protein [Chthoniobacterales bacterium]